MYTVLRNILNGPHWAVMIDFGDEDTAAGKDKCAMGEEDEGEKGSGCGEECVKESGWDD